MSSADKTREGISPIKCGKKVENNLPNKVMGSMKNKGAKIRWMRTWLLCF